MRTLRLYELVYNEAVELRSIETPIAGSSMLTPEVARSVSPHIAMTCIQSSLARDYLQRLSRLLL